MEKKKISEKKGVWVRGGGGGEGVAGVSVNIY